MTRTKQTQPEVVEEKVTEVENPPETEVSETVLEQTQPEVVEEVPVFVPDVPAQVEEINNEPEPMAHLRNIPLHMRNKCRQ